MKDSRGVGRPRSEASRRAILLAARDVIVEVGYDSMTIEAVAARAGVGRQTIYRWWRAKASVVAEAVVEGLFENLPIDPSPRGETPSDRLSSWLIDTTQSLRDPVNLGLVRALAGASATTSPEARRLYEVTTEPARDRLIGLLDDARAESKARTSPSSETLADALIGSCLYRVLSRTAITDEFTYDLLVLAGVEPHQGHNHG